MIQPDILGVSGILQYSLGTIYRNYGVAFRYGLAGSDLKAHKKAYAHFPPPAGPPWDTEEITRAFWSDLRAKASKGSRFAGKSLVHVPRGQYCWLLVKM